MAELETLRALLDDVGRRRRVLAFRTGAATGAWVAALVLAVTAGLLWLTAPTGPIYLVAVVAAVCAAAGVLVAATWRSGAPPSAVQLARLLEERHGGLDDVVVTAVDYAARTDHVAPVADRLSAAALCAVGDRGADAVVPPEALGVAGRRAAIAGVALVLALAAFVRPLGEALDLAGAYLLPSRLELAVEPGDARVRAGQRFTVRARLGGSAAALVPFLVAGDSSATPVPMVRQPDGGFEASVPDVREGFAYRVTAGARRSADYHVTVVHPPQVERIDLDYAYPKALALQPRHEDDGGDIYAPAGTDVTLTVTTDRGVHAGAIVMADGTRMPLAVDGTRATATLNVATDGSYRIAMTDDGFETPDDTEYFIRMVLDRPPDVRVLRPGGDKQVTPLEEVLIEARADDDFGVSSLELVLQKPGAPEVIVPLRGARDGLTASGAHLLQLEDLEVAPGDFVTYFARARDVGRGKPSSESRSDMYFLEVKAFNEEFVAAQSQAMAAGAQSQGVQDLAAAQKEIVVATWKLDSRGRRAKNGQSATDIRAIAEAQRALEQRAAKEAGSQLQPAGSGEPRRRRGPATLNGVGDDPMGRAIEAMRRAAQELDRLQTAAAMPHELEALNQLLRAESEVRRRQVARQQGGGGGGQERNTPDLSALFDQELRKQQETNYETPASSERRQDEARPEDDRLAKLRELARRQEALGRDQQDLARTREQMDAETLKRRLERLTRDQEELRRELEQLSNQLPNDRNGGERQASSQPQDGQKSSGAPGQPQTSGAKSGSSQAGGQQGESGSPSDRQRLRDAAEEMRRAAAGLQQQDPGGASGSADRAVDQLRQVEQSMRGASADNRRRQLGDLQLEARQLADAERRAAGELDRAGQSAAGSDARRQAAAEQERLAGRAERLERQLRDLGRQMGAGNEQAAVSQAADELQGGKVGERMRETGKGVLNGKPAAAQGQQATSESTTKSGAAPSAGGAQTSEQAAQLAQQLDRVADRLDGARSGDSADARRLSGELARSRDLRDRLAEIDRTLERLGSQGRQGSAQPPTGAARDRSARAGQQADGKAGSDDVAGLQQQMADQLRQTRERVDALSRANPGMIGPSTPEEWQPSVSAPGTEAFKQDFARWESLKQNLLLALEKVERSLASELRTQETKDRLNAGASDAVPDEYRLLVEKYYRSLAAPRRPERRER